MKNKNNAIRFVESCYRLYEHKMYYIAYSILHDVGLSEDAVQEAFIRLMKCEMEFSDYQSEECKKYIYTTIKNVSLNIYRKKKREQEIMYLSDEQSMLQVQNLIGQENNGIDWEEMMEDLPTKYSEVVQLLVIDNLSVSETAKELNISEVNVRKRFERAKKMLKRSDKDESGRIMYRTIHSRV